MMLEEGLSLNSIGLILTLSLIFYALRGQYLAYKRPSYPPGPKPLPLIGNLIQLSSARIWEDAVHWAKTHGDVLYLESLGRRVLFVNSFDDATELLSGRSAKYSSRPHMTMVHDLQGWGWLTTFVPYGDTLRNHRSYQQQFIGSPDVLNFLEVQLRQTHVTLNSALREPKSFLSQIQNLPGAVVLMNVYGYQVQKDDYYVKIGQMGVTYSAASQEYFLLDVFPWLKYIPRWLPWSNFHQVAKEGRQISEAMRNELYEATKKRFMQGTLPECMTSTFLLENMREDGSIIDEENFIDAAGTLYIGGVDTSVIAIMNFILEMVKNPEVQRRAQKEIDDVVGTDRLPTFKDMENLNYTRAVCDEVLRCAIIFRMIPGHSTTHDDIYKGYYIPKDTVVFANTWAMATNAKDFPEPFAFKPERWLHLKENKFASKGITFGFGRRACPGQSWAEHLIYIAASTMLATFNIERDSDKDGMPIPLNEKHTSGILRDLGTFNCKITPRSSKAASLLEDSVE